LSTTSETEPLAPGAIFGGYEIVRRLGAGAFGEVYEALRLPLKKRTALKVLHPELARHAEVTARFRREAELVAQVEHPHIVGVFDVGAHEGRPYIAMEYLDGESLAKRLAREGTLPVATTVDLTLAVMSAVATVHARGIVHRDLKPDNLFLARLSTGETQPKLLDFGIAKVREAGLTLTGAVMGTPLYMSPEQAQGSKGVDAASDQWALGVIVFECLTGRAPFAGDSLLELLVAITSGPIPRLCAADPSLPPALDAAVARALERRATARWPSVRAFGAALLPFASPGARARWAEFFAGEAAPVEAPVAALVPAGVVRSTVAFASTGVATQLAPPPTAAFAPVAPIVERKTDHLGVVLAALAGLMLLSGLGAWAVRNATGSTATPAAQPATPVTPTVDAPTDSGPTTTEHDDEPASGAPVLRGWRPPHGHGHGHRGHGDR
jgi:tRNA A-37 threonylcarbamoyl transferase component Bud32